MTVLDNVTEQRDTYSLIQPFRPLNLMTDGGHRNDGT